jgi:8-oxo-dGTP pyrophosphatase MutT (NUDIX family)
MSGPAAAGAAGPVAAAVPAPIRHYALVILNLAEDGLLRRIFMGQESVYIPRKRDSVLHRGFAPDADTNEKRIAAAKLDPNFQRLITSRVVLRKLHEQSGSIKHKYTLQRVGATSKWGFPKGGLLPGETPAHGAIREFFEETGFLLEEDRLFNANNIDVDDRRYHIFYYRIDNAEKEELQKSYAEKVANREGELFHADFFTAPEIITKQAADKINAISSAAFEQYLVDLNEHLNVGGPLLFGGAKKRRSTKRNKNKKRKLTRRK